jgi:hypothetical protein
MTMDGIIGDTEDLMVGQILFGDGTIGDMVGTILGDGTGGIIGDLVASDMAMPVLGTGGTILTMDMVTDTDTETITAIMATTIEVMPTTTLEEAITIEIQ